MTPSAIATRLRALLAGADDGAVAARSGVDRSAINRLRRAATLPRFAAPCRLATALGLRMVVVQAADAATPERIVATMRRAAADWCATRSTSLAALAKAAGTSEATTRDWLARSVARPATRPVAVLATVSAVLRAVGHGLAVQEVLS